MSWVRAFAPASVGNLAVGFDVLGLAVDGLGDRVTARKRSQPGVVLKAIRGDGGRLPLDAQENTASVAAAFLLETCGAEFGVELELDKGLPLGSGLGSSAASAVAGAVATAALFTETPSSDLQLAAALEGERIACGSAHADNAAPSLLGGLVMVNSAEPLRFRSLPLPKGLAVALVKPQISIATRDAREVLGETLPLGTAVEQMGALAGFIDACHRCDLEAIATYLVDHIAEPRRAALIPGFSKMKHAALDAGALGASISGSGPTCFALARSLDDAERIRMRMSTVGGLANDSWARSVGGPATIEARG